MGTYQYSDEEKIKIFDELYNKVSNYVYEMSSGELTHDGEWEAKNHLYHDVLDAFSKGIGPIENKRELRESYKEEVEDAIEYYESFIKDPEEFSPSIPVIFRKRQLLEELLEDDLLEYDNEKLLKKLDMKLTVNYSHYFSFIKPYVDADEKLLKYSWLKKINDF